jgi:zinc protease
MVKLSPRLRWAFLCMLLWGTCVHAQNEGKLAINYTSFTLPNGLTVILHEDHSTPTVAVNVWYHVGSGNEKTGRTGFAHLFEHIMFEGSGHVKEGDFDNLLEAAGGNNNGSTNSDRTNYFETVPSNAVDLALFLESDRMGYLLDAMSPGKVDGQRDVVKNERRQSYENRPYGMAWQNLGEMLYPEGHPYHWPTIGYMEDLTAASYQDVVDFFNKYYRPNNASLVIAGDIDPVKVRKSVEYWFSDVSAGEPVLPPAPAPFVLTAPKYKTLEDNVQLPRLYMAYQTPGSLRPGDAEMNVVANVLAGGKNSRLYKRLVYDLQVAQSVSAFQSSEQQSSSFVIIVTARPGHNLNEMVKLIDEEIEKLKTAPPSDRELQRVVNQYEAGFLNEFQSVEAKADLLNRYYTETGNPDWANEDLARYRALDATDVSRAAATFLDSNKRVLLSIVPKGKTDLAATPK